MIRRFVGEEPPTHAAPMTIMPQTPASIPPFRTSYAVVFAAAALLAACDAPRGHIAGPEAAPPDLQRYITAEAAAGLNSDGRFALAAPSAPGDRPIISAERAGELALASVRTWGPSLHRSWERESGRSIDLASLRVGGRILFARTPYGSFPDGYHPAFARTFGPYYLVTLYLGSDPVVLISVAAYNDETTINRGGLIQTPAQSGAEFFFKAIPAQSDKFALVSPEEAVQEVGSATGARVTGTPELIRLGMPNAPAMAVWKLTLDREVAVAVRGKGTSHRARELYVGPARDRRVLMGVRGTARPERTSALADASDERIEEVDVPVLPGDVVSFETVDILGGGSQQ